MKKVLNVIKKFFIWLGVVCCSLLAVLFVGKKTDKKDSGVLAVDNLEVEDIERRAEIKREEVSDRIRNSSASDIAAEYKAVRRTIDGGIERFRERCSGTVD